MNLVKVAYVALTGVGMGFGFVWWNGLDDGKPLDACWGLYATAIALCMALAAAVYEAPAEVGTGSVVETILSTARSIVRHVGLTGLLLYVGCRAGTEHVWRVAERQGAIASAASWGKGAKTPEIDGEHELSPSEVGPQWCAGAKVR